MADTFQRTNKYTNTTRNSLDQKHMSAPRGSANSAMGHFDTFSYGFDIPASNQLGRINYKINRWDKTQLLIEEQRKEREAWEKQKTKAEKDKIDKMKKNDDKNIKLRKAIYDDKHEKRTAKLNKITVGEKVRM